MRNALGVRIVQKKFVLISTWFDFNEFDGSIGGFFLIFGPI